ncbi:hypothetical protein AB1Y20_015770 [Prymnesium parvum]|uniref:YrhK domain-containing protein n=1 Tax=Prymnesium parvum TaxID=97485 RepID=A0AB34K1X4_PRYPA
MSAEGITTTCLPTNPDLHTNPSDAGAADEPELDPPPAVAQLPPREPPSLKGSWNTLPTSDSAQDMLSELTQKGGGAETTWTTTNEAVRDLHRAITPGPQLKRAVTPEGCILPEAFRLHPEFGRASELAQPGGFRRAHILSDAVTNDAVPHAQGLYARTPLLTLLRTTGPRRFITSALHTLEDGTQIRFESRNYRRGRAPEIVSHPTSDTPPAASLRFCGFKPTSVPYWNSVCFLFGGVLFTLSSGAWMIPSVGGAEAAKGLAAMTVSYPYFVGSLFFLGGCYLSVVEVINANLQEEVMHLNPVGSVHRQQDLKFPRRRPGERADDLRPFQKLPDVSDEWTSNARKIDCFASLRWWGWQPQSVLYWAAIVQLFGAVSYFVACLYGLPGMLHSHEQEVVLVYVPSILGSLCFTISSRVYVAEVSHSFWSWLPERMSFGYSVAICNFIGSALFLIASACYLIQVEPWEEIEPWEYNVSEWGVRFLYALGSMSFVVGALVSFLETLN